MTAITIPNVTPRGYQLPVFKAFDSGVRRFWLCWHRRAGKDDVCLHITAMAALDTPGNYWHCLPEYAQARKAIWEAVNKRTGKRRIDEAFPPEIRKRTREDDMMIEFSNGATWRLVGSDNYNSLVGAGPAGIVFSEYAISDPSAWDYLRPMLLESGGWAIFNSTVRGRNHFWKLGEYAKTDPAWFYSNLTADQTGVFAPEQLEAERRELCALYGDEEGGARFRQEYFNDPDVAIPGAIYAPVLSRVEQAGRIGNFPYDPRLPVVTGWDIGYSDATAIWFAQPGPMGEPRIIDYYEANGQMVEHYAKVIMAKPYAYFEHLLPHDAAHGNIRGESVEVQLRKFGIGRVRVLPQEGDIQPGINMTRSFLSRCSFNLSQCGRGLEALRSYHREWSESLHDWKASPKHDWSSHAADAIRYLAIGWRDTNMPAALRGHGGGSRQAFAINNA